MGARRTAFGLLAGVAAAAVLWNLLALAVGVVNDQARERDVAVAIGGDPEYERYDPLAASEHVELWMGGLAAAVAVLAVPNRHWLPGWRVRGVLQAVGLAATLALLFALFMDRAEYSPSNRPYTFAWQVPLLLLAAAGALAHAWLTAPPTQPASTSLPEGSA